MAHRGDRPDVGDLRSASPRNPTAGYAGRRSDQHHDPHPSYPVDPRHVRPADRRDEIPPGAAHPNELHPCAIHPDGALPVEVSPNENPSIQNQPPEIQPPAGRLTAHHRRATLPDGGPRNVAPTVRPDHEVQHHGTNQRRDEENGRMA